MVCGVAFAVVQFVAANYISVPLTDILASLLSAGAVVLLLRVWQPAGTYVEEETDEPVAVGGRRRHGRARRSGRRPGTAASTGGAGDGGTDRRRRRHRPRRRAGRRRRPAVRAIPDVPDSRAEVARAYAPYLIIIAVFVIAQLPGIKPAIAKTTQIFAWPGLHLFASSGKPLDHPELHLQLAGRGRHAAAHRRPAHHPGAEDLARPGASGPT